jgi:Asp-tRNA(Asn)/Glu-tRNA(Gln) amidotransferase A subunit family amidase
VQHLPDFEAAIGKSVKSMKNGIPEEYRLDGMPDEIEKLWTEGAGWLKSAGADLVGASLRILIKRHFEDCSARGVHAILTPATTSAAFGIGEKRGAGPVECISTTFSRSPQTWRDCGELRFPPARMGRDCRSGCH